MSFNGSDSALGSSSLYLDGVPFKLGEKFKCPPRVSLPETLKQTTVTAALTEEYTFSTEEAVLAWLADVREADEVRRQQDLERAQDETEQRENDASSDDEEETGVKKIDTFSWQQSSTFNENSSWSNPVLANFSTDLLKPTPISSNSTPSVQNTSASGANDFDIRSFDKVDDPFDNLELQTIDDLEELKTVLQSSQAVTNSEQTPTKHVEASVNSNTNNTSNDSYVNLRKNAVKLKRGKQVGSTSYRHSTSSNVLENSNPEYVNFQSLQLQSNAKSDDEVCTLTDGICDKPQTQSVILPPIRGTNRLLNSSDITERIRPNSNPELQMLGNGHVSYKTNKSPYENVTVIPNTSHQTSGVKSRHSVSDDYVNIADLRQPAGASISENKDNPAVAKKGLREAKSSPSLSDTSVIASHPISQSPPKRPSSGQVSDSPNIITKDIVTQDEAMTYENVSFGRSEETAVKQLCSIVTKDPVVESSAASSSLVPSVENKQPESNGVRANGRVVGRSTFYENVSMGKQSEPKEAWNKYPPLPPPKMKPSKVTPALPPRPIKDKNEDQSATSVLTVNNFPCRSMDSEDPYSSLSIEAQAFVNSLTGMGFPRARAARAVLKLGQDHKLVVEHLCLINSMVEKGYTATLAEMALHLFTNDFNKAVKYLDLYLQFQELGFQNEKIREALVRNDIDRDKALDFLMT